jgi:hypothetical protein
VSSVISTREYAPFILLIVSSKAFQAPFLWISQQGEAPPRVHAGLEYRAAIFQFFTDSKCIYKVSIVGHCNALSAMFYSEGCALAIMKSLL